MKDNLKMMLLLGGFLASAQQSTFAGMQHNEDIIDRSKLPKKKIIPSGCKEYFFTKTGSMYTIKPAGYEVVFECIASSDKAAKKKFDKWYAKK